MVSLVLFAQLFKTMEALQWDSHDIFVFQIDLGKQPEVSRREPVSAEEWAKNMDSDGRILNVDYIKRSIFKGVTCFSEVSKTCGLVLAPFSFLPKPWLCCFHYTCDASCRILSMSQ